MNNIWWVKPDQLDDDQKKVIDLDINKNYLVLGPPGSGKTNLLLLRANYLAKSGFPNILILVFTRTLKEFMATGSAQYSFSPDRIMTSHQWMLDLIRQYDKNVVFNDNFSENRIMLLQEALNIVKKNDISSLYEAILLDEAQDYLPEEIGLFKQVARRIFAVADANQKIYDGQGPFETLRDIADDTFELRRHYRNGLRICQLADGLAKGFRPYTPLASTSNYNEDNDPSSVNMFRCVNIEEQCRKIFDRVTTQLKAYPGEYIGIICPLRKDVRIMGNYFLNSLLASKIHVQNTDNESIPLNKDNPVIISTLHSAKGLEFRALHLASFEYIKKFRKQRNMAFMAVTRVNTSLSVYYCDNLPGYFEQADVNMRRPPEAPTLEELFA